VASSNDRNNPTVTCPTCGERGSWFAGSWGPFCSQRCRLIDLGKWFNEEHRLTRELKPGDFEGLDELEPGPNLDRPEE
jgi:endogenous inhibitor of DNA gyrase (YacG/DUF329 family)